MTAHFSQAEIDALAATTVRVATLVEFHFDPVYRLWNGSQTRDFAGHEWLGAGLLGSIDGLSEARSGESQQVRFTLSGTSAEINQIAMRRSLEQAGKLAIVSFQLLDKDWQAVGNPVQVWSGITQPMQASRTSAPEGQGPTRSITLAAENAFYARDRSPMGFYTDVDQQARYPGDRFFQFQARLRDFRYRWP